MKSLDLVVKDVIEKLPACLSASYQAEIITTGNVDLYTEIDAAMLWSPGIECPDNHTLFICTLDDLPLPESFLTACILCHLGPDQLPPLDLDTPMIFIQTNADFRTVCNTVEHNLILDRFATNMNLYRGIYEKKPIQDVIQQGKKVFTNSFMILDSDFKVLGYDEGRPCDVPLYKNAIANGAFDHMTVISLFDSGTMATLLKQGSATVMKLQDCQHPVHLTTIADGNGTLGYGVMICSTTFPTQRMLHSFDRFAGNIAEYLKTPDTIGAVFSHRHSQFLRSLALGESGPITEMRETALSLHIPFDGPFRLIRIGFDSQNSMPADYIVRQFEALFSFGWPFLHKGSPCILVEERRMDYLLERMRTPEFWAGYIERYGASIGISSTFEGLPHLNEATRQAVAAARLSQPLRRRKSDLFYGYGISELPISLYDDIALIDTVDALYARDKALPSCPTELLALRNACEKDWEETAKMLFTYLACDRKLAEAAHLLHVHRNTLAYRLNKLPGFEIIDERLRDPSFLMRTSLWFTSLDYKKALLNE